MKEPPIGRIGYVVDGLGRGRSTDGTSEICCNNCRHWFDSLLRYCPVCEHERPGFCKAIRTAQLNNQLYVQAGLRSP